MKYFFSLVVCILSCLILFSCNSHDARITTIAKIGDPAPDFSLKDITGETVRLSSYRDKVVLLEFWATWCPPCKASIPALMKMQNRYKTKGFTVVGVSVDTKQNLASYLSEFSHAYHINYPVLMGNADISAQYNVRSIPVAFLIDKKGILAEVYRGFTDDLEDEISTQIEKII